MLADALHNMHGRRLHGFAILITLGDELAAERATGRALAAGARQATEPGQPKRIAAWLRARTLRDLSRWQRRKSIPTLVRRDVLASLGVDDVIFQALAAMSLRARAVLVASTVERFALTDIETIISSPPTATRRAVADARARYLRVAGDEPGSWPDTQGLHQQGELAKRVEAVVSRAMSADRGLG
ncbi:MAG: hypothetical protein H0W81_06055 [Chloroflexi bacterium]|nr:hypothetical protein [Chloroflexota bacterium]